MTTSAHRTRLCRARFAARSTCVLVVLIVCALLTGCGSSTHSNSPQANTATTISTTPPPSTTTTTTPGTDPSGKLDTMPEGAPSSEVLPAPPSSVTPVTERSYLTAVFNDAQRFWEQEFSKAGVSYAPARLTMFASTVHSGCGVQADTGPFYCGADRTVYLDLGFFELLARHAGVGRFGQAYIVGHELGHHVQFVLGISARVGALNQQDPGGTNPRSVRVELQADCLAGVWAHSSHARGQVSEADLTDALKTAALVGDDFQQNAAGHVADSALWTHGSSAQRRHWLMTGFQAGNPDACDTFASNLS